MKHMFAKVKRVLLQKIRGSALTVEQLRMKGLTIGEDVDIYTSKIDYEHGYLITIGNHVTLASDVRLLTHDASTKKILGYSKIGRIDICDHVFIGAQSIILPNVYIGDHVIIGAGSVVTKNIPAGSVAAGNPCRVIGTYEQFEEKNQRLFEECPRQDTDYSKKTVAEKKAMQEALLTSHWGFDA